MNAQSPEVQPEAQLEVQPDPTQTPSVPGVVKGLRLPEPDRDNITVLLHNLPKDPVLPWNHYDSPWEAEDDRPLEEEPTPPEASKDTESTESSPDLSLETGSPEPDSPETDSPETIAPSEPVSALEPSPADDLASEVLPPVDHIPSEAILSQFAAEDLKPQTIAPEEQQTSPNPTTSPSTNLGEPGYVHLAPASEEPMDQETERLQTLATTETPTSLEIDTPIVAAPESEPDQQLLAQLG